MESTNTRLVGIYIDITQGSSIGDCRISRVEAMPGGQVLMRPIDEVGAVTVILNHLDTSDLFTIMEMMHGGSPRAKRQSA